MRVLLTGTYPIIFPWYIYIILYHIILYYIIIYYVVLYMCLTYIYIYPIIFPSYPHPGILRFHSQQPQIQVISKQLDAAQHLPEWAKLSRRRMGGVFVDSIWSTYIHKWYIYNLCGFIYICDIFIYICDTVEMEVYSKKNKKIGKLLENYWKIH
jgi:hypothetical protein